MNIISIITAAAGLFGYSDAATFLKDIIALAQKGGISEGALDHTVTDLGTLIQNRVQGISPAQIQAGEAILVALIPVFTNRSVATVEQFAGVLVANLPVLDPAIKFTPEHGVALVQALKDVLADENIQ